MIRKKWFMETIIFFTIFIVAGFIFNSNDPAFLASRVHPYWIIVMLIASRYGLHPGCFAGFTAAAIIIGFSFGGVPTRNDLEKMVEAGNLILPISFILTGFFLGNIRQKYIDAKKAVDERIGEQEKVIIAMQKKIEELERTRKALEDRIVRSSTTARMLYESSRKIELMEEGTVHKAMLEILSENFNIERSSFYEIVDNHFILRSTLGQKEGDTAEGKIKKDDSIMSLVLRANKYLSAKEIVRMEGADKFIDQYGKVLAMCPVRDIEGRISGVINIEKMEFILFTKQNLEMVALMAEWVGFSINVRNLLKEAKLKSIRDGEYKEYVYSYFQECFKKEYKRAQVFSLPLSVAVFKIGKFGFYKRDTQVLLKRALISEFNRIKGPVDMLFLFKFDGTFAIISPMKKEHEIRSICEMAKTFMMSLSPDEQKITLTYGCGHFEERISDDDFIKLIAKDAGIKFS